MKRVIVGVNCFLYEGQEIGLLVCSELRRSDSFDGI